MIAKPDGSESLAGPLAAIIQKIANDIATQAASMAADEVVERLTPVLERRAEPRLVGRQDIADVLGVSVASLDRMVASGDIPSRLIGGSRRFDIDDVLSATEGSDS